MRDEDLQCEKGLRTISLFPFESFYRLLVDKVAFSSNNFV